MIKIYLPLITLLIAIVCLNQANASYYERAEQVRQVKKQICTELSDESFLKREDAMDFCIARLLFIIQNLKDQLSNGIERRYLIKRPTTKPIDDEIKRNSIDSLHGLTLG